MKKRFLNRLKHPYLRNNPPENIFPTHKTGHQGENHFDKATPRSLKNLPRPETSRGLLRRTRRERLETYKKMLSSKEMPHAYLDTLEQGSMVTAFASTGGIRHAGERFALTGGIRHPLSVDGLLPSGARPGGAGLLIQANLYSRPLREATLDKAAPSHPGERLLGASRQDGWRMPPGTANDATIISTQAASIEAGADIPWNGEPLQDGRRMGTTRRPSPPLRHLVTGPHRSAMGDNLEMPLKSGRAIPSKRSGRFYQSITQLEGGFSKVQGKRLSQTGLQLSERRKLKILYGDLSNGEIDGLFRRGLALRGRRNDNLFRLLESRLDVVLYRIGFFQTIPSAQEWIRRGDVLVNGRLLTIANHLLQPGDVISISPLRRESLRRGIMAPILSSRPTAVDTSLTFKGLGPKRLTPSEGPEMQPPRGGVETQDKHAKPAWAGIASRRHADASLGDAKSRRSFGLEEGSSRLSFDGLIGAPGQSLRGQSLSGEVWRRLQNAPHLGRRERLRLYSLTPSHIEVSYLRLVAIYLYPPQRILLPAPVDIERIGRA